MDCFGQQQIPHGFKYTKINATGHEEEISFVIPRSGIQGQAYAIVNTICQAIRRRKDSTFSWLSFFTQTFERPFERFDRSWDYDLAGSRITKENPNGSFLRECVFYFNQLKQPEEYLIFAARSSSSGSRKGPKIQHGKKTLGTLSGEESGCDQGGEKCTNAGIPAGQVEQLLIPGKSGQPTTGRRAQTVVDGAGASTTNGIPTIGQTGVQHQICSSFHAADCSGMAKMDCMGGNTTTTTTTATISSTDSGNNGTGSGANPIEHTDDINTVVTPGHDEPIMEDGEIVNPPLKKIRLTAGMLSDPETRINAFINGAEGVFHDYPMIDVSGLSKKEATKRKAQQRARAKVLLLELRCIGETSYRKEEQATYKNILADIISPKLAASK